MLYPKKSQENYGPNFFFLCASNYPIYPQTMESCMVIMTRRIHNFRVRSIALQRRQWVPSRLQKESRQSHLKARSGTLWMTFWIQNVPTRPSNPLPGPSASTHSKKPSRTCTVGSLPMPAIAKAWERALLNTSRARPGWRTWGLGRMSPPSLYQQRSAKGVTPWTLNRKMA